MKYRFWQFLSIILYTSLVFSQEEKPLDSTKWNNIKLDSIKNGILVENENYIIYKGDTLMIDLPEVTILAKLNFKTNYDKRYYYWYRKKTIKAYPYAKLASERLQTLNERLAKMKSKRQRSKYIRIVHNYLDDQFSEQLKKLTRTEGRILLKLIYRQTGRTAYDLVKDLRSGWKAFWYNATAKLFKLSLKSTYDPIHKMEDYMIEDILQRAFSDGVLEEQKPKNPINLFDADFKEIDVYQFVEKK
ncbi:MAG: DUF4294 domain-containing protein [Flavobacteriaceae bacterium]|nr:DUF4294 domain-containing protein [Flavobacteriaceae bacterium]